jgi:hypothetical protein
MRGRNPLTHLVYRSGPDVVEHVLIDVPKVGVHVGANSLVRPVIPPEDC